MTFTTLSFGLFLPMVFALYWFAQRHSTRILIVVVASYAFYAWWSWRYCLLLLGLTLFDFFLGRLIAAARSEARRRTLVTAGIIGHVGVLGWYKYAGLLAATADDLGRLLGLDIGSPVLQTVVPAGISFFTFHGLSYLIDVHRQVIMPVRKLPELMAFMAFFPLLVAGPIERGWHLLPQLQRQRAFDEEAAVDGARQILWGFFKKVAIADNLATLVDPIFHSPASHHGGVLAVAAILFTFQIYLDFSAYSDIAIGVARLFGYDVLRNFAHPFFSRTIAEFWRRWHISLSTWFRDYVYLPLGGSRVSSWRWVANVLITFGLSGLWHGASSTFLIWGLAHGLCLVAGGLLFPGRERRGPSDTPGGEARVPQGADAGRMLRTFAIVCLLFVIFRAPTLSDAGTIFGQIFSGALASGMQDALGATLDRVPRSRTVLWGLGLVILLEWHGRRKAHPLEGLKLHRPLRWLVYTSLAWTSLYFAAQTSSPFIYFQF